MTRSTPPAPALQRRVPVQERSRQTVTRILDSAAAIIEEQGVDAVSTRSVADRAGVSYPSLYRFFRDREEILDRLLERHIAELEAIAASVEPTWDVQSPGDLMNAEFALHVDYYRHNPSAARLWMGGRASTQVAAQVHARILRIAEGMHNTLVKAGLIPQDTDSRALFVAVELGDRVLELAYRDRHEFDTQLLEIGRQALSAYMDTLGVA